MTPKTPLLQAHCRRCGWHTSICRADPCDARASLAVSIGNHLRQIHNLSRVNATTAALLHAELSYRAASHARAASTGPDRA